MKGFKRISKKILSGLFLFAIGIGGIGGYLGYKLSSNNLSQQTKLVASNNEVSCEPSVYVGGTGTIITRPISPIFDINKPVKPGVTLIDIPGVTARLYVNDIFDTKLNQDKFTKYLKDFINNNPHRFFNNVPSKQLENNTPFVKEPILNEKTFWIEQGKKEHNSIVVKFEHLQVIEDQGKQSVSYSKEPTEITITGFRNFSSTLAPLVDLNIKALKGFEELYFKTPSQIKNDYQLIDILKAGIQANKNEFFNDLPNCAKVGDLYVLNADDSTGTLEIKLTIENAWTKKGPGVLDINSIVIPGFQQNAPQLQNSEKSLYDWQIVTIIVVISSLFLIAIITMLIIHQAQKKYRTPKDIDDEDAILFGNIF